MAVWRGTGTDSAGNVDYDDVTVTATVTVPATDFVVTEGSGTEVTGYYSGSYGSISGLSTFAGATVVGLTQGRAYYKGAPLNPVFSVVMSGNRASSFWTTLVIDGFGAINSSTASSVIYDGGADTTTWFYVSTEITFIEGTGTFTGRFT